MDTPLVDAAVRRGPFGALLLADAISMHGNALAQLAIPWFVLETTGSAARTGVTAAAGLVPVVLASLLGGGLADRFERRAVSVVADIASMLAIALIPLLHALDRLPFALLLALVFLGALLDTPGATARAALLPDLARLAGLRLERANTLHEVVESGAGFAGPLMAGVLIATLGASAALCFDAATFAVSAVLVGLLVPRQSRPEQGRADDHYLRELAVGLRFVWHDGPLRAIYGSAVVLNFLIAPLLGVVLPYHAKTAWGSAGGLGVVLAAFGAGSVLGALVYGAAGHRWPQRGTFLVGVAALGGIFCALAFVPPLAVMALAMLLGSLVAGPNGPLIATILQQRTPEELRGRVFGVTNALCFVSAPLGVLLAGSLLARIGVQPLLAGAAALFMSVVLWLALDSGLRALDGGVPAPAEAPQEATPRSASSRG